VQSVLNLSLRGDFLFLDKMWQVQGNRRTMNEKLDTAKIVHYIGMTPWSDSLEGHQDENAALWRTYRSMK